MPAAQSLVASSGRRRIQIPYNRWAAPLYDWPSPYDYRIVRSGRGSSKTNEITRALITHAHQRKMRICVAREHKVSIGESAQPELVDRINEMSLMRKDDGFRETVRSIDHANGSHIYYIGMSTVSEEDIKGLSLIDILWIEEAHMMSRSSWEIIYPTVRKRNSEIWISFNPKYRTDISWELAQRTDDPVYWVKRITFRDNKFFTAKNERDRLRDKVENPLRYDHVWEGEPDDSPDEQKLLPYGLLRECVRAWDKRPPRGAYTHAGYDVADKGDDRNALALRNGPELFYFDMWFGTDEFDPSRSVAKAADVCREHGVSRFNYDASGVGAAVRGPLRAWMARTGYRMAVTPCEFGGKVQAPDIRFIRGSQPITQQQHFRNWGSQAGWNLQLRAEMTRRLNLGQDINPDDCLFINPHIMHLEILLAQMSQPIYEHETKLRVIKAAKGEPSPDGFDAVRIAYSRDCRRGLKEPSK